jgi:hypothetical protein
MSYIGNQPQYASFLSDTFSGNGSTTVYTMAVAPANTAAVIVAIWGVLQDPTTYGVVGRILTFSQAPPAGTGNISVRYLALPASNITTTAYRSVTEFTATAGQTTFTPASYTPGFINVFRSGVRLGTSNYVATNGVTVTLNNAAAAGDLISIESFFVSSVLNAIPNVAGAITPTLLDSTSQSGSGAIQVPVGTSVLRPATPVAGMTRFNTTQNLLEFYDGTNWQFLGFRPIVATGGSQTDITVNGVTWRVHSFTTVGNSTFTVSNLGTVGQVQYLIVAGGGAGGGDVAGGGGGGRVITGTFNPNVTSYTITVGDGGAFHSSNNGQGGKGGDSAAFGITALGGTGGTGRVGGGAPVNNGWNGGGGSHDQSNTVGLGGFPGGDSAGKNTTSNGNGGGGGSGGSGVAGTTGKAGDGGPGVSSSIRTGSAVTYGGGGGGNYYSTTNPALRGLGVDGGGDGATDPADNGNDGEANRGGGGGGGPTTARAPNGGRGGSGIVVIRYPLVQT